jgi:hypothetical protein
MIRSPSSALSLHRPDWGFARLRETQVYLYKYVDARHSLRQRVFRRSVTRSSARTV